MYKHMQFYWMWLAALFGICVESITFDSTPYSLVLGIIAVIFIMTVVFHIVEEQ